MSISTDERRVFSSRMQNTEPHGIVLFDGGCTFCNSWVRWIICHDAKAYFRFVPLQPSIAQQLLLRYGQEIGVDTVVLMENNQLYTESTAVLRICRNIQGLWKFLSLLIYIPRVFRDPLYRWVARNRYRWFGKNDGCPIPTGNTKKDDSYSVRGTDGQS